MPKILVKKGQELSCGVRISEDDSAFERGLLGQKKSRDGRVLPSRF